MRALRRLLVFAKLVADAAYDIRRYFRHSASGVAAPSDEQLAFRILAKAHSIEKALALPSPRAQFGVAALTQLLQAMTLYRARGLDMNHVSFRKGVTALRSYIAFHQESGQPLPAIAGRFEEFVCLPVDNATPSTLPQRREYVLAAAHGDFRDLCLSRHSIRMFSREPVDIVRIDQAIALAQRTPSVCNRQSSRVYIATDPRTIQRMLATQGGARGYSDEVPCLLVLTASLTAFKGSSERHQAWVDGGMFAMSLLYALHYQGLGACALNWSADRKKDRRLRSDIHILEQDEIMMLVAVGNLRTEWRVAMSPRRSIEEIVTRL